MLDIINTKVGLKSHVVVYSRKEVGWSEGHNLYQGRMAVGR